MKPLRPRCSVTSPVNCLRCTNPPSTQDGQTPLARQPVQRPLHHPSHMSVDLVDIRMPPERRGIDRFEDFHDDFRGSGRFGGTVTVNPNGSPTVTGRISIRILLSPRRCANRVPRPRKNWVSWARSRPSARSARRSLSRCAHSRCVRRSRSRFAVMWAGSVVVTAREDQHDGPGVQCCSGGLRAGVHNTQTWQ